MEPKPTADTPASRGRSLAFQLAAVLLTVISAVAATGLARWLRTPKEPAGGAPAEGVAVKFPNDLFKGWKKPDLVLLLTGQQHGYLLPCGCSRPQIGGLERRYNLIKQMEEAGWPVVPVDLGDVPQKTGPAGLANQQGLIKYIFAMRAMNLMGYKGVGFGESEANLGLFNTLAEYSLNHKEPPVVMANLMDAKVNYPEMTHPWNYHDVKAAGVRVGVTAVISPVTADHLKGLLRAEKARFAATGPTLENVAGQMKAGGVSLPVLLYQGPLNKATACAEAFPQFPIVLCLTEDDGDPADRPTVVRTKAGGESLVVQVGKKGKFVGVVGVWKTGKAGQPFEFKYQRAEMTEDLMTPEAKKKDHPVIKLIDEYTQTLKAHNYLEKYGQMKHPIQVLPAVAGLRNPVEPTYVGSEACKRCHEHAYDKWKETPHSHAYKTLVTAKDPGNRQYDPECIVCHTVGFGHVSGFVSEAATPKLKDVGCESCHGPSSVHAKNPNDPEWRKRINPWPYLPKNKQKAAIDHFCQKCHDTENDVTWTVNKDGKGGFERKWPLIEHATPAP